MNIICLNFIFLWSAVGIPLNIALAVDLFMKLLSLTLKEERNLSIRSSVLKLERRKLVNIRDSVRILAEFVS